MSYFAKMSWSHDLSALSDLVKVRLSDGSDGLACFPSDKELSDGEKNDVITR